MSRKDRQEIFSRTLRFHLAETTRLDHGPGTYERGDQTAFRMALAVLMLLLLVLSAAAVTNELRKPGTETELSDPRMGGAETKP